jgi:hypothetical protein
MRYGCELVGRALKVPLEAMALEPEYSLVHLRVVCKGQNTDLFRRVGSLPTSIGTVGS